MEKEKKKNNCRPLTAKHPAATMCFFFVLSTGTFQAKVVYTVLGSQLGRSYH